MSYIQVVSLLQQSLPGVKWPQLYKSTASSAGGAATFDLASLVPGPCMAEGLIKFDYVLKFRVTVLLPMLVLILALAIMMAHLAVTVKERLARKLVKDQYLTMIFCLLFSLYPGLG